MEDSSVSVIIPCYNRAALVGDTLRCLLSQTSPPREIIVVDDGSTDGSGDVVQSFGGAVSLIRQENLGPGAARNAGLRVASGKFIQFFDSDDLASTNKLEVQLAALKRSDADFAYCPWVRAQVLGARLEFVGPVLQAGPVPDWKPMLEWQMGAWCLVFQNCLFRREAVERAGWFRTDLMPSEDSEFFVRILLAGAQPVFTSDCLVFYRVHEHHQITGSGLTSQRRSDDWNRYLEVVGEEVANLLSGMHPSTRREIALNVYRHNRYRLQHGLTGLRSDHPFLRLKESFFIPHLLCLDYADRVSRRLLHLSPVTPNSPGLCRRFPDAQHKHLLRQAGFQLIGDTRLTMPRHNI